MDDPERASLRILEAVDVRERGRDALGDVERELKRKRSLLEDAARVRSIDELERVEGAALEDARAEEARDAWVIEAGQHGGFVLEEPRERGIRGERVEDPLDRHHGGRLMVEVVGAPDLGHAPARDQRSQTVAGLVRHSSRGYYRRARTRVGSGIDSPVHHAAGTLGPCSVSGCSW